MDLNVRVPLLPAARQTAHLEAAHLEAAHPEAAHPEEASHPALAHPAVALPRPPVPERHLVPLRALVAAPSPDPASLAPLLAARLLDRHRRDPLARVRLPAHPGLPVRLVLRGPGPPGPRAPANSP